ncbi:MAG: carbonic anhydrase [Polyangiaceae bacterium]
MPVGTSKQFDKTHPPALAVYCSDGRFTDAVEELLHTHGHPRLDTLTLPGGAALLELGSAGFSQLETMRGAATFLIRAHGTTKVVLIAHEGCGFYANRYRMDSPEAIRALQLADLRAAARWVLATHEGVSILLYFAYIEYAVRGSVRGPPIGKIAFQEIEL